MAVAIEWPSDDANCRVGPNREVTITVHQASPPGTATAADPTQRSWPLTKIEDEDPTEWWFPIRRGD